MIEIPLATVTREFCTIVYDEALMLETDDEALGVHEAHRDDADPYDYFEYLEDAFVQVSIVESLWNTSIICSHGSSPLRTPLNHRWRLQIH